MRWGEKCGGERNAVVEEMWWREKCSGGKKCGGGRKTVMEQMGIGTNSRNQPVIFCSTDIGYQLISTTGFLRLISFADLNYLQVASQMNNYFMSLQQSHPPTPTPAQQQQALQQGQQQ